ncbi:hypothetical protein DFI_19085 (plasmid) [Deinococcus ficus]|uniref:Uncharacterized protein n=1 Tax=Deinococcus ficus TaxID=317577 RepID=A0A221T328_9DEIO|nr:hypothetical protein DFI_19085 [Deinococcus ficus]
MNVRRWCAGLSLLPALGLLLPALTTVVRMGLPLSRDQWFAFGVILVFATPSGLLGVSWLIHARKAQGRVRALAALLSLPGLLLFLPVPLASLLAYAAAWLIAARYRVPGHAPFPQP